MITDPKSAKETIDRELNHAWLNSLDKSLTVISCSLSDDAEEALQQALGLIEAVRMLALFPATAETMYDLIRDARRRSGLLQR